MTKALIFVKDDFVKVVGTSGDFRYGYVAQTAEGENLVTVCFDDEGDSKMEYERLAGINKAPCPPLSPCEQKVLRLVTKGLNAGQIAHRLDLAPATVRAHTRTLKLKLRLENRDQLIVLGRAILQREQL